MNTFFQKQLPAGAVLVFLALVYPWVHSLSPVISPGVLPWMGTVFSTSIAWWLIGRRALSPHLANRPHQLGAPWLGIWLAAFVVLVLWRSPNWNGQTMLTLAAIGVLVMAISIGSFASVSHATRHLFIMAWLIAALLNSLIAICQYYGWSGYFSWFMNGAVEGEAYGNLRQRNQLATLTAIGSVALIWGFWGLHASANTESAVSERAKKLASWMALTLFMAASAASQSRTGMLCIVLITLFTFAWRRHLSRQGLTLGLAAPFIYIAMCGLIPWVAYLLSGQVGSSVWGRFEAFGASSCSSRLTLYQSMVELVGMKPWLGWGWRELIFAQYVGDTSVRHCEILDNAHNLPLHLSVELGIPAALALTVTPLVFVIKSKPWKEMDGDRQLAWVIVALVAMHSMLEYPLWYGPFTVTLGLCLGLLWPGRAVATGDASDIQWRRTANTLVLGLVMVGLVWSGWGYYRLLLMYRFGTASWPTEIRNGQWEYRSHYPYTDQIRFFNYMMTPLTTENAKEKYALGEHLMHFSPEPRVIAQQINAAYLSGVDKQTFDTMLARFKRAFPKEYEVFVTGKAPE